MTFQEIMAKAGAEQAAGWGESGRLLTKQVKKEEFNLYDYINQILAGQQAAEEKDVSRKRRKSGWRLGGALLGGVGGWLLGGPGGAAKGSKWGATLGAGAGSLLGSKVAQATEPGGWKLKGINPQLAGGMFFKGQRERADLKKEDVSRYISDANKFYEQSAWTDAVQDAFTARKMMLLDPRDWFGDVGVDGDEWITNKLGQNVRPWKPEWDEWMPGPPAEDYMPSYK